MASSGWTRWWRPSVISARRSPLRRLVRAGAGGARQAAVATAAQATASLPDKLSDKEFSLLQNWKKLVGIVQPPGACLRSPSPPTKDFVLR